MRDVVSAGSLRELGLELFRHGTRDQRFCHPEETEAGIEALPVPPAGAATAAATSGPGARQPKQAKKRKGRRPGRRDRGDESDDVGDACTKPVAKKRSKCERVEEAPGKPTSELWL